MQTTSLRYGKDTITLRVPDSAALLNGPVIPALANPQAAVREALKHPIGSESLVAIAKLKKPATVCITMSDITRPVPNELLISAILEELNAAGIPDSACTILIATGMHRPSTLEEREYMLGQSLLQRCHVVDHEADATDTHVRVCDNPPVSVNRLYAEADLKIVTGLIEPHFMAGYSGGRKGICPGLVDLATVQRFHGFQTMGDPHSREGLLEGNPCHDIAIEVATQVGCHFLVNCAITHERQPAAIYAGNMVDAHRAGCKQVADWTSADIDEPYDLVITSGGGYPLDESFYQTIKGIVMALPALHDQSTLLVCSSCNEVGSPEFTALMEAYGTDYHAFLNHIETSGVTGKDQWSYQLHTRVLKKIGVERLLLASDGVPIDEQPGLAVTPLPGTGGIEQRMQMYIDSYVKDNPDARIAVVPEGPYTMLRVGMLA